jgi:DNA-directed RNA polymerase specialized sigma24 family protein
MSKNWQITHEQFERLLNWLDPDREEAANRYERIRQRLIKIFLCGGCPEAEDAADETVNRVTMRLNDIIGTYEGNRDLYFYGVARNVLHECLRKPRLPPTPPPPPEPLPDPAQYDCFEECLAKLPSDNRYLIVEYYQEIKHAKIEHRKQIAAEQGIALNALRIRAHRIRTALQRCVEDCLEKTAAN